MDSNSLNQTVLVSNIDSHLVLRERSASLLSQLSWPRRGRMSRPELTGDGDYLAVELSMMVQDGSGYGVQDQKMERWYRIEDSCFKDCLLFAERKLSSSKRIYVGSLLLLIFWYLQSASPPPGGGDEGECEDSSRSRVQRWRHPRWLSWDFEGKFILPLYYIFLSRKTVFEENRDKSMFSVGAGEGPVEHQS